MAKLLIIDDDKIVCDAISASLTRAGHEVLTAGDGQTGVRLFKETRPDLVILDRKLPRLSGSHVFEAIRSLSPAVPVLIVSGYDAPEEVEAYIRYGAAGFISKSWGLSVVLEKVNYLLNEKKAELAGGRQGRPPLVLLADDDPAFCKVLRKFLVSIGCEVLVASEGEAAERLALARTPDIVMLDIYMPGKSGVMLLRDLSPKMPSTGFIIISGADDEIVAKDCLKHGAFDYIAKPVNLETLGNIIRSRMLLQKKFA